MFYRQCRCAVGKPRLRVGQQSGSSRDVIPSGFSRPNAATWPRRSSRRLHGFLIEGDVFPDAASRDFRGDRALAGSGIRDFKKNIGMARGVQCTPAGQVFTPQLLEIPGIG